MKGKTRKKLTREEWQAAAKALQNTLAAMLSMYELALSTTTVKRAEPMRTSIRHAQHLWHTLEEVCAEQHGFAFSDKLFHGEGWTYLA